MDLRILGCVSFYLANYITEFSMTKLRLLLSFKIKTAAKASFNFLYCFLSLSVLVLFCLSVLQPFHRPVTPLFILFIEFFIS